MEVNIILEQVRYVLLMLAAIAAGSVGYLFFDAYRGRPLLREGLRTFAFLVLALSFILEAFSLDVPIASLQVNASVMQIVAIGLRILSSLCLAWSFVLDPLIPVPKYASGIIPMGIGLSLPVLSGICWFINSFLFIRKASKGLERHLLTLGIALGFIGFFELTGIIFAFRSTDSVILAQISHPYGPLWVIRFGMLFGATVSLLSWVYWYLTKRFTMQTVVLNGIGTTLTVILTCASTTFFLSQALDQEVRIQAVNDASLVYALISGKMRELSAYTRMVANDTILVTGVKNREVTTMQNRLQALYSPESAPELLLTDVDGKVLADSTNPERIGTLAEVATAGTAHLFVRTVLTQKELAARLAIPMSTESTQLGFVVTIIPVDSSFLDTLALPKSRIASIYLENSLAGTTAKTTDGFKSVVIIRQGDSSASQAILTNAPRIGKTYDATHEYLGAFLPLPGIGNTSVGTLFVGASSIDRVEPLVRALQKTYAVSLLVVCIMLIPTIWFSSKLQKQLR